MDNRRNLPRGNACGWGKFISLAHLTLGRFSERRAVSSLERPGPLRERSGPNNIENIYKNAYANKGNPLERITDRGGEQRRAAVCTAGGCSFCFVFNIAMCAKFNNFHQKNTTKTQKKRINYAYSSTIRYK